MKKFVAVLLFLGVFGSGLQACIFGCGAAPLDTDAANADAGNVDGQNATADAPPADASPDAGVR